MNAPNKQMPFDAPTSQGHIGKSHDLTLALVKTEGNRSAQKSGKLSASMQDLGELGNAAIDYAKSGFEVFPLHPGKKLPATANGHLSATSDINKIAAWWRKNPDCNIGLLPGEMQNGKRLAVLDVDPKNGGDKTLAAWIAEHGNMPDTLTAITGRGNGGVHHYFYVPDDVAASCIAGDGLDFKSSNGYVVAAPSIHPDTLKPYGWRGGVDLIGADAMVDNIADAPEWLISKLRSRNRLKKDRERLDREGVRPISPQQISDLKSALLHIPADDYDLWMRMGMALYELDDVGKELWIEWSKKSDKFSLIEAMRKWRQFAKTDHLHFESVFHEAGQHGWLNPLVAVSDIEANISLEMLESLIVPIDLSDEVFEEHPFIVDHILPCGETTLLAGHGSAGKSFLSLVMAIHVAMDLPIGNLQVKKSKVLFFSGEDDGKQLNKRTANICRLLNIDRKSLINNLLLLDVRSIDPALHRARKGVSIDNKTILMNRLITLVDKEDPGLVIIDNASETFDDEENARSPVRKFMRSLRDLASPSRAVLLLTHVNKANAGSKGNQKVSAEDYSGSSAWHNSARSRLSLARGENDGDLVLTHQKSNYGALIAPIGFIKVDGVPIIKGELTKPIEERREALDKVKRDKDKDALYQVLLTCEVDHIHTPVAVTGTYTAFKHLSEREEFPSDCDSSRTNKLLQELRRDGRIYVNLEKSLHRKVTERWRCVTNEPDLV